MNTSKVFSAATLIMIKIIMLWQENTDGVLKTHCWYQLVKRQQLTCTQSTEIIQNIPLYRQYMEIKTILLNQGLGKVCSEYTPIIAAIRRLLLLNVHK